MALPVRRGSSLVQTLQPPTSVLAAGHFLAMPCWQRWEMDQVTYGIPWVEAPKHPIFGLQNDWSSTFWWGPTKNTTKTSLMVDSFQFSGWHDNRNVPGFQDPGCHQDHPFFRCFPPGEDSGRVQEDRCSLSLRSHRRKAQGAWLRSLWIDFYGLVWFGLKKFWGKALQKVKSRSTSEITIFFCRSQGIDDTKMGKSDHWL